MVRSQWLGAVVAGLAWTGLLWSQSPANPSAAPNLTVGATITVNETGRTPEQCQVQASWTEPNGTRVLQVRSLSTGETITVMSHAQPGVYRVYHWGQSHTPPAGVPTAPATQPAQAAPPPTPVGPAALAGALPQPAPLPQVNQPRAPVPADPRTPSGIIPVSGAPTPISNVVQAAQPVAVPQASPSTPALPILPQPRDSSGAAATPAVNPAPYNPTIALPAINTRSPQQPTPGQLTGNGAPTPPAPTTGPVSSVTSAPVSSVTSTPTGTPACGGCGGCGHADGCSTCPGSCCPTCCSKPSLWSRLFGKSSCCGSCPQAGGCSTCPQTACGSTCGQAGCSTCAQPSCSTCAQPACGSTCAQTGCSAPSCGSSCGSSCTPSCGSTPSCTCEKPSLWSRMFSKSSSGCCPACPSGPACPACPTEPCGGCTTPAPAAGTPAATPGSSGPEVAPHMPPVSRTPTSTPQVSDYRQSWGKVEPWGTQPGVQTATTTTPNETVTATPTPAPAQGNERLAPVAPTATGPSEGSPSAAVPMVPMAPPAKRQLFSRLRGNNPPAVQNVIPLEQVPGAVTMPPAQGKEYGAPATPLVVMPATEAPAGRRSLLSHPLFHGKQPTAQNGIPLDPSVAVIMEGTPGAAPQPVGAPNPAPEKRGLLARLHGRQPAGRDDERPPSRDGEREMAGGPGERGGLFNRRRPNEIDADEPNAFSPPRPKEEKKDRRDEERYGNAFPVPTDKMPPQYGMTPTLPQPRFPQAPWQIPQAPFTSSQPRPQMPMAADAGLPSGMANAFTPSWTGRPLPADLDNRPQPTNGFGDGENMSSPPQVPQAAQMAGANAFPLANGGFPGAMPGGMMAAAAPRLPGYLPAANAGRQSVSAGYLPAPAPSLQPAAYSSMMAHMTLPASPGLPAQALSTPQMLIMLRESLYPSQREWAAEQLSRLDWHREQVVVASLVQGAREDPAPAVRAACVHALGAMKVNTLPVVQTVQALQKDKDLRVRQEAAEALVAVGATAPGKSASDTVQRVGGSLPAE